MQWDDTANAGFCSADECVPWLPVNPNNKEINVVVSII